MGVDLVRAGAGRAPFLVAALTLLSIVLLFNWWTLSTDNLDLLKQIEDVSEHLKSSSALLEQCRRDRASLESRLKTLEDNNDKLVRNLETEKRGTERLERDLKKRVKDVGAAEKQLESSSTSLNLCTTELDSLKKVDISKDAMIATMRMEKSDLQNQIQNLKEQSTKLSSELDLLKSKAAAAPEVGVQNTKSSTTAAVPPKVENNIGDDAPKNLAEPDHAAGIGNVPDRGSEKDEAPLEDDKVVDPRFEEMQDAAEEKKEK